MAIAGFVGVLGTLVGAAMVSGILVVLDASPLIAMIAGLVGGAWAGGCTVSLMVLMLPNARPQGLHDAIRGVKAIDDLGDPPALTEGPEELLVEIRATTQIVRDRRLRLEQQLVETSDALAREKHVVRKLRDQVRHSLSVQDAFLSRISHELRTPLNAITGYVEMLLEEIDPVWAPDLGRVQLASSNLTALVTSVLDLTDLQSGAYAVHPERVVLAELIHKVVDSVRFISDTNRNMVEVQADPSLEPITDPRMLRSVLFNLISNAAKYTTDGVVRVTANAAEPDHIEIVVTDTGIGMTRRQIDEAFRPFTQADESSTRRYDGSGVGLAVVKGFVEAMSGRVELQSEPGRGARVTVRLPFEIEPRSEPGRDTADEAPTVFVR